MPERSDSSTAAWLALFLFGIYLFSFSGRIYSSDGLSMFAVTESFVKRGEFSTDQMWTLFSTKSTPGLDDEVYSKYGYGTSLFAAPLYALALVLPMVGLVQTTLLTSAIVIALTGALVYLAARRLDFSGGMALVTALLFGLATPAWVYAKEFWSEPFSLFTLFAAFYFLLRGRENLQARDAFAVGVALGLAVATRPTNLVLVPFYFGYGLRRLEARSLAACVMPLLPFLLSIAYYNWARFGSPFTTGYRADETFSNPVWLGAYGLLFSSGKALFVYAPFLAALPYGAIVFYRRARRELLLIAAIFLTNLLIFSAWYYWWGGTDWGPRFLVPLLPFLALLCAPIVELVLSPPPLANQPARVALTAVLAALVALSLLIEILGVSVSSLTYRLGMLNISSNPEADAIFVPSFSPLVGYWSVLKPRNINLAWIRVVGDGVQVDWLVIGLTLLFIAFCGAMLVRRRGGEARVWLAGALVGAIVLSLFSLARYDDGPSFDGSVGYGALLKTVQREAQARDVLILNDDARAPFFMNENRARIRWYGLSRDPARWDEATQALFTRLAQQYKRVWFSFDDSTAALPDPTRAWLESSLRRVEQDNFGDGVHLILFQTETHP